MKTTLKIEGMMCEGCVSNVTEKLSSLDKVKKVDVNLKAGKAVVEHDGATDEELIAAVVNAGYRASAKHGLFS